MAITINISDELEQRLTERATALNYEDLDAYLRQVLKTLAPAPQKRQIIQFEPALPCSSPFCMGTATVGIVTTSDEVPPTWSLVPLCKACTQAMQQMYEPGAGEEI